MMKVKACLYLVGGLILLGIAFAIAIGNLDSSFHPLLILWTVIAPIIVFGGSGALLILYGLCKLL